MFPEVKQPQVLQHSFMQDYKNISLTVLFYFKIGMWPLFASIDITRPFKKNQNPRCHYIIDN
jgi:hypothetical protein